MLLRFALRDALVVAAAVGVWTVAAPRSAGDGAVADLLGLVAGLGVGAAGFVLHEWGHLAAGAALGARFGINANLRSGFLFRFDTERNTLRQFVGMSLGGFAVTGALVWGVYAWLPDGLLATRVARGAALFLAGLTLVLELPLLLFAIARGRVPAPAAVRIESERSPA